MPRRNRQDVGGEWGSTLREYLECGRESRGRLREQRTEGFLRSTRCVCSTQEPTPPTHRILSPFTTYQVIVHVHAREHRPHLSRHRRARRERAAVMCGCKGCVFRLFLVHCGAARRRVRHPHHLAMAERQTQSLVHLVYALSRKDARPLKDRAGRCSRVDRGNNFMPNNFCQWL